MEVVVNFTSIALHLRCCYACRQLTCLLGSNRGRAYKIYSKRHGMVYAAEVCSKIFCFLPYFQLLPMLKALALALIDSQDRSFLPNVFYEHPQFFGSSFR